MYRFEHRVKKMCHVLEVSRSGYYNWLKRPESKTARENRIIIEKIKVVHADSKKANYGSPRMVNELYDAGFKCSEARVARLMKQEGIMAKRHKKFKVTTNSKHKEPISPNLLQLKFKTDNPNKIWVSDITYIKTGEGWLYFTSVIDLYARNVVGWSMSNRMYASQTTEAALQHACMRANIPAGLIFHSDKGIQYACKNFRKLLNKYNLVQSMSGKGNCYDNAVAESFFKTLKVELIYQYSFRTRAEARTAIFDYIETFYNKERRHSSLGNISPDQYLNNYYLKQEHQQCLVA
ncbi:MAG: IS3 family transposase [Candidatus Marinimicrobia bacterium]|nr:IS3 family transposase [Candidatus Neomarinimicrobiota bacterium]